MKTAQNHQSARTVIIVDDDVAVLKTVCEMVRHMKGFVLAGAYATGEEALPKLKANPPDIVMLDVRLGAGMSGFELATRLHGLSPPPAVIFFSGFADPDALQQALSHGCCSFLPKPLDLSRLEQALKMAARDELYFPSEIREILPTLPQPAEDAKTRAEQDRKWDLLTTRQKQCLKLRAEGFSAKMVAAKLEVTEPTAVKHVYAACGLVGAHSAVVAGLLTGAHRQKLPEAEGKG